MSSKKRREKSPLVTYQERLLAIMRSLADAWHEMRGGEAHERHGFEHDMHMLLRPVFAAQFIDELMRASLRPMPDVTVEVNWRIPLKDFFLALQAEGRVTVDIRRLLDIMEETFPSGRDCEPTTDTLQQFLVARVLPGPEALWRLQRQGYAPVSVRELLGILPVQSDSNLDYVALGAVFGEQYLLAKAHKGTKAPEMLYTYFLKRGTVILAKRQPTAQ